MFTYNGRDSHRNLTPARINLPYKPAIADILPERRKTEDDEADIALQRLPAPGLKGTWARAYALLTKLVSKIGWDELLKTRSAVFVMEEEYRMQKAQADVRSTPAIHEDGTVAPTPRNGEADDDASTRGVVTPVSERVNGTQSPVDADQSTNAIPTIKVSTESDREREAAEGKDVNGDHAEGLEKPSQAAVGNGEKSDDADDANNPAQDGFSFSNKRLCERWLDNLFMVLYEDLRIWTIFRAEVAHFKTQHVAYRKTGLEWEILGELGQRLHHKEEAKEAYQRCLESSRYSIKPWQKLMEIYADEGDLQRTLQTAIRVAAYQHNEYAEAAVSIPSFVAFVFASVDHALQYPTSIAHQLFKLGQIHGHAKISYTLLSMGLPEPIAKVMESYLNYGQVFQVEGYDF